ncbi:MAG TPA: hypothetical protein VGC97_08790 [Pyrinomonadaceae bacterium]|jgi:hypothetical protein
MNENLVIEVTRVSQQPNKGHVFGTMSVKKDGAEIGKFSTLERGGEAPSLKIGDYEMHHSIKHKKRNVQCLRPTNMYISSILIHDAYNDDADELEGCIAPFEFGAEADKLHGSAQAMVKLWEMLGGFDKTHEKKIKLRILSNVPGDNRTAENWLVYRKAFWLKKYGKK